MLYFRLSMSAYRLITSQASGEKNYVPTNNECYASKNSTVEATQKTLELKELAQNTEKSSNSNKIRLVTVAGARDEHVLNTYIIPPVHRPDKTTPHLFPSRQNQMQAPVTELNTKNITDGQLNNSRILCDHQQNEHYPIYSKNP